MKIRNAQLIIAEADGVHNVVMMDVIEYEGKIIAEFGKFAADRERTRGMDSSQVVFI